jgi:PAS domain S-box-containing protein
LCKVTRFLSQGLSRVAVEHIDISERRRVEDALRTSEAKLQGVIGSAMDAIISVDEQQCIVAFNRAAEAVFRCAASEAVGSTLDRFIPMSLREGHREHIRRFGSEGVTARSMNSPGILTAIRSNGEEFPIEATISRLQTGGENLYTVILRDVTKRRQVEQALLRSEKLASVGRMAASIAHEINNPLGAVTNLLFLVQEIDDLPESARRYLEIADGELKRVAHITRQSLGFYREGNAAALTSVNAVMESAVDLLKSKIAAKRAVIEREWDGDVEITAVAGELRQVFSNLLANSLDAIDEGGTIKLRVSAGTASGKGHRCVRVTIADNGKGIPASSRKHLFEPFFTTKGTIGTGLGLWVSKRIVGHHGGSIQMRSNASGSQRGTIFSIVLPIEPASPAERTQSATV